MTPTNYRDDILPQDSAEDDSSLETATSQPLSEAEIEDLLYGEGRSTEERLRLLRALRDDIADREGYDVGLLNDGFHDLVDRLKLDYLFIDTHPGLNEETLLSIAISDVLVLILRPDRQDFQGTAVTVDVARKLGVPEMLLLVNKALHSLDFDALRKQVEATYNATVGGVFAENEQMLELASGGVFCLRYPEHPFTQEVQRAAARLLS